MIYLCKKVCLVITIHRNTPHILDMSCCHKHQQQRYHHENIKTCMFIHYIYVYILFPLTKAIPIMFERVATDYQTLQTMRGHNATRYHNFNTLPYVLPHVLSYIFSTLYIFQVTLLGHLMFSNLQNSNLRSMPRKEIIRRLCLKIQFFAIFI